MLLINELSKLYLGIQGENQSRIIQIDVNAWLAEHANATFSIWHKRNGDATLSATGAMFDSTTGIITWSPTETDTYVAGEGMAEVRMTENGVIKKTRAITTGISPSVTGGGTALGSDWQSYINEVDRLKSLANAAKNRAVAAQEGAEFAASHYPYVDPNTETWWVYNANSQEWINTNVRGTGLPGPKGERGPKGDKGDPGEDGANGVIFELALAEYSFQIVNGHLILTYGGDQPNFEINEEGHLIYTIGE